MYFCTYLVFVFLLVCGLCVGCLCVCTGVSRARVCVSFFSRALHFRFVLEMVPLCFFGGGEGGRGDGGWGSKDNNVLMS